MIFNSLTSSNNAIFQRNAKTFTLQGWVHALVFTAGRKIKYFYITWSSMLAAV